MGTREGVDLEGGLEVGLADEVLLPLRMRFEGEVITLESSLLSSIVAGACLVLRDKRTGRSSSELMVRVFRKVVLDDFVAVLRVGLCPFTPPYFRKL